MSDELEQIKLAFMSECGDFLQEMESLLLYLESGPRQDTDAINGIFRAVHTIKGTSGMFGFDGVTRFAHVIESVLEEVRSSALTLEDELISILFECRDHLSERVQAAVSGVVLPEEILAEGERLIQGLAKYLPEGIDLSAASELVGVTGGWLEAIGAEPLPETENSPPIDSQTEETSTGASESGVGGTFCKNPHWHISLRCEADVFRNGLDPLSFLRYLREMGEICNLATLSDLLPADPDEFDAESCYLGFELRFETKKDREALENLFEFIQYDARLKIIAPHAPLSEYRELLESMPEEEGRALSLLQSLGSLTAAEVAYLQSGDPADLKEAPEGQRALSQNDASFGQTELKTEGGEVERVSPAAFLEKKEQNQRRFVRVNAEKLDHLINLVGELVVAESGISRLIARERNGELEEASSLLNRLVVDIRENALQVRMAPIDDVFKRFYRVVRELSRELGKDVELKISGGDTELDKTILEKITDPLMHLVRNVMDHGVETPEERVSKGKPVRGTLEFRAYHDTGAIVIEVKDDGRGLDRERILERAVKAGLAQATQSLSDERVFNFIFEPGFSTAREVSDISGRGVGMDVVKRNIESLRGNVRLASVAGEGTRVIIRLPLTLAIIDGFLVQIADGSFIIPLDMVQECGVADPNLNRSAPSGYMSHQGKVLPCLNLERIFESETASEETTDVAAESEEARSVVIVRYGEKVGGLIVNELLGEQQTVIKPLGTIFQRLRGFLGMSILGTGKVAMVLDIPALLEMASSYDTRRYQNQGVGEQAKL